MPVNLRAQPLLNEVDGIMLCDYDAGDHRFHSGDRIKVVRNWTPFKCAQTGHRFRRLSQTEATHNQSNKPTISDGETSPSAHNVTWPTTFSPSSNTLPEWDKPLAQNTTPYWCVRPLDNTAVYTVPAVSVCLLPPAADAVRAASK